MLSRAAGVLILLSTLWASPVLALEVPEHTGPVVDLAGVLSRGDQAKIAASLLQFQQTYGPQLQVLVVPSLEDESLEGYSIKVVDKWKLGAKGKDDGVLLLVAIESRKVRIEVGRGLEGNLPDVIAGRIIRTGIVPFFKQGQTGAGILVGLGMIAESVGGKLENVPAPRLRKEKRSQSSLGYLLFIGMFLIAPLFGRRRRGGVGGALLSGLLIGAAMSGGRHGGGGFGGGGFGGGGGGGFSGGGASGSW
ncbi:Beta-propeller domains of methanol dehydrogenase type [hydrothermal vent metagenome]|uniref:Beta-propeller domains of methanol dehydrogenase type n=1 Tax=hydrothermal vent metagenome TaxID=652676 RepID=A0A3B0WLT5_9ZZZZ